MSALDLLHKMTADLEIQLVFILSGTDSSLVQAKIYPELLQHFRSE